MSYVARMTNDLDKMKRTTAWFPEALLARVEAWGGRQGVKLSTAMRMLLIRALDAEDARASIEAGSHGLSADDIAALHVWREKLGAKNVREVIAKMERLEKAVEQSIADDKPADASPSEQQPEPTRPKPRGVRRFLSL